MPDTKPSLRERIKGWLRTDGITDADLDTMADDLVDVIGDDAGTGDAGDDAAAADPSDDGAGDRADDDPDDDDDDKDDPDDDKRSGSGKERSMTRAEWRRMEREEAKKQAIRQRSGRYGDVNFTPNPVMTLARDGEEGLSVGDLVRVQVNRNAFSRQGSRELEWMERSEYVPQDMSALAVIPFEFLSRYAPMTREKNRERQTALRDTPPERIRAAITTANNVGYGMIAVEVDLENSQAWLYDRAPVLDYLTVKTGSMGEQKYFYGSNTAANKPTPGETGEGGAVAESSPQLTNLSRLPVPISSQFPISSSLIAMGNMPIDAVILGGAEALVSERVVRNVLSGPYVGATFAEDAEAMQDGLMDAGITNVNYGADNAAFDRDDIIAVEQNLRALNPMGTKLAWITSVGFETLARNKRIGGTEAVRFVAERNTGSLFEGIMNPSPGGMGVPYVSSTHLGKTVAGPPAVSDVNPAFLIMGSQLVVCFWGGGIEVIMFNNPGKNAVDYGFRVHANVAFVNPHNGYSTRQG